MPLYLTKKQKSALEALEWLDSNAAIDRQTGRTYLLVLQQLRKAFRRNFAQMHDGTGLFFAPDHWAIRNAGTFQQILVKVSAQFGFDVALDRSAPYHAPRYTLYLVDQRKALMLLEEPLEIEQPAQPTQEPPLKTLWERLGEPEES